MKDNKFTPLLNTTGGIVGKKAGVLVNEVTDQVVGVGIGFGSTIGRSRLIGAIGNTAMNVITNKANIAKALRKGSEIAQAVGSKIVPVDVKIAVENDKANLRDRLKACELQGVDNSGHCDEDLVGKTIDECQVCISTGANCPVSDPESTIEIPENCPSVRSLDKETTEDRTARLRREEDEAANEAGCALYDNDELIDAYDEN